MLLKVLICWLLLAIAIAAILCRLIHKAKVADRALRIQRTELSPDRQKIDARRSPGDY
ncbi:hypothetical protein [Pseudomonas putida]|uniref:hypothetical protein n=1 Tax=Pseudomonas putida TaxID=303 RepID=UPI003D95D3CB